MKAFEIGSVFLVVGVLCFALAGTASAAIPLLVNHQGVVKVGETPFGGTGEFRFAFVDGVTYVNLWTNDGTHLGDAVLPDLAVALTVGGGVYSIGLGDTTQANMVALPSTVFDTDNVLLRVWFDDGVNGPELMTPDQPVTSAAYAFHALTADNADMVGGQPATDFMPASTDNWVDTAGDAVTGDLAVGGSVTIGAATPGDPLEVGGDATVSGTLTTGAVAYASPQTSFLSIPSAAFSESSNSSYFNSNNGSVYGTFADHPVTFLAPIFLPHDATLVRYNARVKDSDATRNIEVRLVSQYPTGGSALVANSTLTSSDSPGQTKLESPDLNIAIDNEEYAYLVETYWTPPATPADIQMYHVHIEFTVNTPRP